MKEACGISIITNFGCSNNCWYCVMKKHPLFNIQHEWNYSKMDKFIKAHKKYDRISISGGGEPLNDIEKHREFWNFVKKEKEKYNLLVSVHTRSTCISPLILKKLGIDKIVLSIDNPERKQTKFILDCIAKGLKMRAVHVATKNSRKSDIESFINFCIDNKVEFSIKKLHGYDDGNMFLNLKDIIYKGKKKAIFNNIKFIEDKDYNMYYMPDNTIRDKFLY